MTSVAPAPAAVKKLDDDDDVDAAAAAADPAAQATATKHLGEQDDGCSFREFLYGLDGKNFFAGAPAGTKAYERRLALAVEMYEKRYGEGSAVYDTPSDDTKVKRDEVMEGVEDTNQLLAAVNSMLGVATTLVSDPHQREVRRVRFSFRTLAKMSGAFMLLAFVLGAIITYTGTDYTQETDHVYLYYSGFNPCIWFDWYPANVVGSVAIAAYCLTELWYGLGVVVFFSLRRDIYLQLKLAIVFTVVFLNNVLFPNIFASNLYERDAELLAEGLKANAGNSTDPDHVVALIAARGGSFDKEHHEMLLNTTGSPFDSGHADVVIDHTYFYIFWLMGNLLFMFYHVRMLLSVYGDTGRLPIWKWIFFGISIPVTAMGATATFLTMRDSNWQDAPDKSWLLSTFDTVDGHIKSGGWAWVPALCYKLMWPATEGFWIEFRAVADHDGDNVDDNEYDNGRVGDGTHLTDMEPPARDEDGQFEWPEEHETPLRRRRVHSEWDPDTIMSQTLALLVPLLLCVYLLEDHTQNETVIPVAAGFRYKPYRYLFIAGWGAVTLGVSIAVGVGIVRSSLLYDTNRLALNIAAGCLLVISHVLCVWVAIPELDDQGYVMILPVTSFGLWVLAQHGLTMRAILYSVVFWGTAACSGIATVVNVALLVVMMAYGFVFHRHTPTGGRLQAEYVLYSAGADALDADIQRGITSTVAKELPQWLRDRVACCTERGRTRREWLRAQRARECDEGVFKAVPTVEELEAAVAAHKQQRKAKVLAAATNSALAAADAAEDAAEAAAAAEAEEDANRVVPLLATGTPTTTVETVLWNNNNTSDTGKTAAPPAAAPSASLLAADAVSSVPTKVFAPP